VDILNKVKIGKQYRSFIIDRKDVDVEKRTIGLSFSSEEPVERWWGREILDHKEKSVNLRRLKRGGALLIDHEMSNQVGVIEKVWVDEADRKGRSIVRFGRSAKAEEIFQDVLDEIRTNVSVGYQIDELVLEEEKKGDLSTYRATRWEPYEISLVSVPADINVGVGRGDEGKEVEIKILSTPEVKIVQKEERKMEKCEKCGTLLEGGACPNRECGKDKDKKSLSALEIEQGRINAIRNLCKMNKFDARMEELWIHSGLSFEEISNDMLRLLEERGKTNPDPLTRIDLPPKDVKNFSLTRAIVACRDNNWTNAPFELECSREVAKRLNQVPNPNRFFVPFEVLERPIDARALREKRDVSVAAAGGGYLVATENLGFIEILRNRSVAFRMGVRRLSGLQGNVTIPKQTGAATPYWLATEATAITESQQTFTQVALTPKNAGAYTEISRQLLLQSSPGAEAIVTNDLASVIAIAADLAVLNGSGGAQPQGLLGTAGIGTFTGTNITYALLLESQSDVATANVTPVAGGYVATPAVAAILMAKSRFANTDTPVWNGNIWNGTMIGYPAMSSNQMPGAGCVFGDWSEIVVGEWGVLEVEVNPYANFQAGIIGVRAIYSLDCAVRRIVAFSWAATVTA